MESCAIENKRTRTFQRSFWKSCAGYIHRFYDLDLYYLSVDMSDSIEAIAQREEELRTKAVQDMVEKEADKNCVKSSDYHAADRAKSAVGVVKMGVKEKYHEHQANKERKKLDNACTKQGVDPAAVSPRDYVNQ